MAMLILPRKALLMSLPIQQPTKASTMSPDLQPSAVPALRIFPAPGDAEGAAEPETAGPTTQPKFEPLVTRRVPELTDDYLAYLKEQSARLETATPFEILQ